MTTILLEGWTKYIHSYAIVNLLQLVALQKRYRDRLRLVKKEAMPYQPHWEVTQPSVMLTAEEHAIFSEIPDHVKGQKVDLVYRISFPFDIRDAPGDVPVVLFYTSEEQVLSNDMFIGGTVQDFVRKCKEGKILPTTPSSWSAEACVQLGIQPAVIPHGIHLDVFSPNLSQRDSIRQSLHIPSTAFVFLHVGAMTMSKNVSGILEGFVEIAKSNPNVYLLLKGLNLYHSKDAFVTYIQQLTQRGIIQEDMIQHLQTHVCLLMKDATSQEMASLYNTADCYIAPYYQEGFNLPVLEALACGLPVIVPDGGPTNDFVPAECSYKIPCSRAYVPPRGYLLQMKQQDIHDAMVRAMREKRRWNDSHLIRAHTWHNIAEKLMRLLTATASKAPPEAAPEAAPEATPYVTGERFQNLAEITIMTEHYLPYFRASKVNTGYQLLPGNRTTLQEGAQVEKHRSYFVYGDLVRSFLERVAPHIGHPFTLFSHNSDENIDESYAMLIDMVPNLEAWHAVNVCFRHPKLHPIPIGIANSMWPHGDLAILDRVCKEGIPKTKMCYFGFRVETNPRARQEAMVLREHYPWISPALPYEAYLKELSQHRYCICPAGNGIDTHRFWECVYLGVTPIVLRSTWAEMWRDKLPMVMVDHWLDARPEELTRPYTIHAYRPPVSTCVVLVHLGKLANAPYLQDCIHQLRLFYKGDVYLYTDDDGKDVSYPHDVIIVTPKTVPMSDLHRLYMSNNALSDIAYREHFWYHCSRRFLAIHDVASHLRLSNILHIENDVMMYQDIGVIMDKLQKLGYKIGGTFANPSWVIPGIMYFADWTCTEALAHFFEKNKAVKKNDMETIASFAVQEPGWFTPLPVVTEDYPLPAGRERMYRPWPKFDMVFDAAALGQYIGGVDPRNIPGNTIGYINPDSEYRMDQEKIEWRTEGNLRVPYLNDTPVCNLHIHSKDLARWSSQPRNR